MGKERLELNDAISRAEIYCMNDNILRKKRGGDSTKTSLSMFMTRRRWILHRPRPDRCRKARQPSGSTLASNRSR